jgi:hypothetical protein
MHPPKRWMRSSDYGSAVCSTTQSTVVNRYFAGGRRIIRSIAVRLQDIAKNNRYKIPDLQNDGDRLARCNMQN